MASFFLVKSQPLEIWGSNSGSNDLTKNIGLTGGSNFFNAKMSPPNLLGLKRAH